MNLWVLFLCRFLLHSSVKKIKVMIVSVLASAAETILLCIPMANPSLKILLGYGGITTITGVLLFEPKSKKYFYKVMTCCYLAAFILGGILILFESLLGKRRMSYTVYGSLMVLVVLAVEKIYIKLTEKNQFQEVLLYIDEKNNCHLKALIDSGNGLVEPLSRLPVSVVEEEAIKKYEGVLKKEKFRIIPFHSIGKDKGILEAYFMEKMEIKKDGELIVVKNPVVAITKEAISKNKEYQMILHPKIFQAGGTEIDF